MQNPPLSRIFLVFKISKYLQHYCAVFLGINLIHIFRPKATNIQPFTFLSRINFASPGYINLRFLQALQFSTCTTYEKNTKERKGQIFSCYKVQSNTKHIILLSLSYRNKSHGSHKDSCSGRERTWFQSSFIPCVVTRQEPAHRRQLTLDERVCKCLNWQTNNSKGNSLDGAREQLDVCRNPKMGIKDPNSTCVLCLYNQTTCTNYSMFLWLRLPQKS